MTTTRIRSLVPQITSCNVVAINKIIIFDVTGIEVSFLFVLVLYIQNRDKEQGIEVNVMTNGIYDL